jgi:type VI secretion system protein ImpM
LTHGRVPLPGYYGKLPCAGDFIRRGLDQAIRAAVDLWLQEGLARQDLCWSLSARPWRFAAHAGVFGPAALGGLLAPSRDRVGRLFPIFIAAKSTGTASDAQDDLWFAAAEALLKEALREERDADALEKGLRALEGPCVAGRLAAAGAPADAAGSVWWSGEDFDQRTVFENKLDAAALETLTTPWRILAPHLNLSQSPSSDDKGPAS